MKIYVTSRFSGVTKEDVESLCTAVRSAGLEDFSFIRDVEHYQKVFDKPADVWRRSKEEIAKCDALLIDVSDAPTGGRVLEAGIAYGLGLPILVIVKRGTKYKDIFNGVAARAIEYGTYEDVTKSLALFMDEK